MEDGLRQAHPLAAWCANTRECLNMLLRPGNAGSNTFTDHKEVLAVSKKWFRIADTYGVEVAPGQDPALMLAVTAVLDQMAHEAR